MPDIKIVNLCSCCKRTLKLTYVKSDTCWECSGRPTSWSSVDRRALPGKRDPSCHHDIP